MRLNLAISRIIKTAESSGGDVSDEIQKSLLRAMKNRERSPEPAQDASNAFREIFKHKPKSVSEIFKPVSTEEIAKREEVKELVVRLRRQGKINQDSLFAKEVER